MEEEIKGEERSADEAVKDGNAVVLDMDLLWVKYMEAKLASKSKHCQPSHPFTICRVPRDIRSVDNVAHDPLIVSIGPYHRGNPSLLEMEEVKWRNLNEFRGRAGKDFNKYLMAMKEIEPRARDCYSGKINMEADEFIEMMLLDGLFIIQMLLSNRSNPFLFKLLRINSFGKDPIFTIRGMLCRVGHDMLLLENQLPFFVLECLWNLTSHRKRYALWKSACGFLRGNALQFEHKWDYKRLGEMFAEENKTKQKKNPEIINADGVHHLLHLVYLFLKPTSLTGNEKSKPTTTGSAVIKKVLAFLRPRCHWFPSTSAGQKSECMECIAKLKLPAVIKKMKIRGLPFLYSSSQSKKEQPPPLMVIPSAVELHEAGVEFQCEPAKSFLDIKFEQGTLKMPRLSVQDSTKSLLRNFIAYEQCFPSRGSHFTSYCSFMDYLVNTPRDVEILKQSKIIENWLGSDEEVALLFNDLGKGIFLPSLKRGYLGKSAEQVFEHTKKTWPKWRAKLMHDYFSNPWAIISLIAATFVIFLTSVQTYYSVFT
ncbi:hypothetical protein AAC387_Pa03g2221 [Persea americana]